MSQNLNFNVRPMACKVFFHLIPGKFICYQYIEHNKWAFTVKFFSGPLPRECLLMKTLVFPLVTYACETWKMKARERRRMAVLGMYCMLGEVSSVFAR